MNMKSFRLATALAVLLALSLVFMMPVGAEVITVNSFEELNSNLIAGNTVNLGSDIILTDNIGTEGSGVTGRIQVTSNVELDLSSYNIYACDNILDGSSTAHNYEFISVKNGATLTIDGTTGAIIVNSLKTVETALTSARTVGVLIGVSGDSKGGNLIVNGGSIIHNGGLSVSNGPNMAFAVDVYGYGAKSTLKITDGTISSPTYIAVRLAPSSTSLSSGFAELEMEGGVISGGQRGIWIQPQQAASSGNYKVSISDGEISGSRYALDNWMEGCGSDTSKITISGGSFENNDVQYPTIAFRGYDSLSGTDCSKHIVEISNVDFIRNNQNGDTIDILLSVNNNPTVTYTGLQITGDSAVSFKNELAGTFSVPQIGSSYEWYIDGIKVDGEIGNTATLKFTEESVPSTHEVTVKVFFSDSFTTTSDKFSVTVPAKYTVTYNAGGGSGSMEDNLAYSDANVIDLPPCTFTAPEGQVFKAWQIDGTEYAAGVSYTVTADTSVTAVWKEVGAEVKPEIAVTIDVAQDGKTTTISSVSADETTKVETTGTVTTITDLSTGVKMDIQFESVPTTNGDSGEITGSIQKVSVSYPEEVAESTGTEEVKQQVLYEMSVPTEEFLEIDSKVKDEVKEKVTKKEQRANVLAMITATHENLDTINNNITEVKITFTVPVSLISNSDLLKAYHVKGDTVDVLPDDNISIAGPEGGFYTITITSDKKFSSYVLAEEIPKTTSSGSAVDTGSGNYQYYPRDVPADGIVSFGTSKVVTGMELPTGSSGKVTLNIKPDFAMPENGFYAFEIDAPGYNLAAKINGGLSFQIPVADLEAAGFTANDIVLFHGTVGEDGTITWEALPTNLVRNEAGIAYYKAAIAGCSPFYIGFVKDGSVVNTEVIEPVIPDTPETPVTPDEPEVLPPVDTPDTPEQPAESPAPILGMVLGGLAAAVVLRRK